MSQIQMSPLGRFEKVLLPTDGSEFSRGAERIAIEMSRHSGAQLLAISVLLKGSSFGYLAPETDARLEEESAQHLSGLKREAEAAGVRCVTSVIYADDPYKGIVEAAKDNQGDIIVMGRRGRRGLARLMLGDATAKVIGYAPCSVMVVPKSSSMWRHVVLATDGSRSSDAATVTAAAVAKCCATPIAVLSVRVPSHSERRQAEAQSIVDRALKYLAQEGVAAQGVIDDGLADEVIIKHANQAPDALIVLGSHGRTGFGRVLFGSKTERVINQANCPVLVVGAGSA